MTSKERIAKLEKELAETQLVLDWVRDMVVRQHVDGIATRRVIVADKQGRPRISLGVDEVGAHMGVYAEDGKCQAIINEGELGGLLVVADKEQREMAHVGAGYVRLKTDERDDDDAMEANTLSRVAEMDD